MMTEQDRDEAGLPEATDVIEHEASEDEQTLVEPKASDQRAGKKLWLVAAMVMLLILLAVAAAGFWYLNGLGQRLMQLEQTQSSLEESLLQESNRSTKVQNSLESANKAWQRQYESLEKLVVTSAQRWSRDANRSENRWPLEEALTLTRLAQQRLQLDSSARSAISLLSAADAILVDLDQAAVLPLRRQLAADILALESTSSTDVNGYYFQLEALAEQVRNLDWNPEQLYRAPLEDNVSPAEGFWQGLKSIVVVSRLDVPMQAPALQSDFEQWRQRFLLLIKQTQLALLAHNQALYDAALQQSSETLETMASQLDIKPYRTLLAELSVAVLNPEWPDIQASADTIEQYLVGQEQAEQQERAQ